MKFILIVLLLIPVCSAFNMLICTPLTIKSLNALFSVLAFEVAKQGHHVTFISPFGSPKIHPNIESIAMPKLNEMFEDVNMRENRDAKKMEKMMSEKWSKGAEILWSDERMSEIMKRMPEFDIFFTMSYYQEYTFPLLRNFSGHFVQYCTPGKETISLSRQGNWLSPAVVPGLLTEYDEYMTFWERAINLPSRLWFYQSQQRIINAANEKTKLFFPDFENPAKFYDRVALTLINGNFALDSPQPLLPNQVEIGLINVKKPEPLPRDMEEFVEDSGNAGVIYFSLGSHAKFSTDISTEIQEAFMEAFKRIPQRILWKMDKGEIQNLPNNVKIQSWMPQQDILGHPKTRLFISHCGNLGTQEAKYHGVPVLGIPLAFDQPRNAARMKRKGYAEVLELYEITADRLVENINKLINDSSYSERMKIISNVLHDEKETPAERAIWWLEYIVRHNGAPHLQYPGNRLSLAQYLMLDVLLFYFACLMSMILILVFTVKKICCSRKHNKVTEHKKNK